MKLTRALFPMTVFLIFAVALATERAMRADAAAGPEAQEKDDSTNATSPFKPGAAQPAIIDGKTIEQWLASLKDRDPAVRARAVELLGERSFDPTVPAAEQSRLHIAVTLLLHSDKSAEVRQAAAFFADLQGISRSPEHVKKALEERKRIVKSTPVTVRLVDSQGRSVAGAVASSHFHRDADREPSFTPMVSVPAKTSDAKGELTLQLSIPGHHDAAGIYAIRQDAPLPIVGLRRVSPEEIRAGEPVTIVMHPACRVRLRVECPGFGELAEKYHAELGGPNWWRAAYVWLGENHQAPRPLFTSSTTGQLEFLLPPGRFLIMAYGSDATNAERTIEVKPGHRLLSMGVVEVSPSNAIRMGIFRGYWRSIRRESRADAGDVADGEQIDYRRPHWGIGPKSEARQVQDVAYSPDGTLLATAHWYNADPGEVKLWDTKTGSLAATLPVPEKDKESGVTKVTFSPDGKILAGSVGSLPNARPPGIVVLWDVARRRELKVLRGHSTRLSALAFAPDGRTLAAGGEDRTVRLWDVSGGRDTDRIDGNAGRVRSLAYSPDGAALASGSGYSLKLQDIPGHRAGAILEPDGFLVRSVAFAPDGRTLAVAGMVRGPGNQLGEGQVRLFDLTKAPPVRRAELTLQRKQGNRAIDCVSDVAFTPDSRRVAAVAMRTIVIWDAATGEQQESLDRVTGGSSADRLAISPDGRWLAITQAASTGVSILEVSPPRP